MENSSAPSRTEAFPVGLRVLVVDDDPCWLKILEKMLRRCNYEVTTCGLARVALELLRERKDRFDIVISDVNMPDMDGFKLLEHVGLEMDLPVIMMSVDGETSRVMKGVQHGACDYLLKPVRMKELKNIWQHVLRKRIHEVKEIESFDSNNDILMIRSRFEDFDERQLLSGADLNCSKKRKDADYKDHVDQDFNDPSTAKKARVVWSVDLHQKFVNAVNQIGFDKVGPKKILDLMNVPGLTRENVASHLQKYRLYLSRLQKQNEERTFGGIMQSNISSKESSGSFSLQESIKVQHNNPSNRTGFSGKDTHVQERIPGVCRVAALQTTDAKISLTSDTTKPPQKVSNISQLGVVLSSKGMTPTVDYKSHESSISKNQSLGGGIPVMQFRHYPKQGQEPISLLEDYSHMRQHSPEQHVGYNQLGTSPSVSLISSTVGIKSGPPLIKSDCSDYKRSHPTNIPPIACTMDSITVQVERGIVNSRNFGGTSGANGTSSITSYHFDQNCINGWEPPSQKLSLKNGAGLAASLEDIKICSLQSYNCLDNISINGMEIFEYNGSPPMTELPSNLYEEFQFNCEYLFDLMEYPTIDDGLFT